MASFNQVLFHLAYFLIIAQAVAVHAGGGIHAHRRAHERLSKKHPSPDAVAEEVIVTGPTVIIYEFNGVSVPVDQVCTGIMNGTFVWPAGASDPPNCTAYGFTLPAPSATPAPVTGQAPAHTSATMLTVASDASVSSIAASVVASSAASLEGNEVPNNVDVSGLSGYDAQIAVNPNVTKQFPDGELDCSAFPFAYGAVPVDWVGLGGWSGIQYITVTAGTVTNINTAIAGNSCKNPGDGSIAYCSYACPAGYQKSQWPSTQGGASMAVSVGGLMCGDDGKLHLANPSLSKYICIPGTGQVNVQNSLSTNNAICRTDYPGTEDETVPMVVQKGKVSPLTCPDASTYYKHLGMPTTAEYYVNMKNVTVDKACTWGNDGSSAGNWAPTVFGVGMDTNGKTWLSIQSTIQNDPSSYEDLDFSVELQGDFGGAKCFYTNGHYCISGSPGSYDPSNCQTTQTAAVPGCTVELLSGNATYVLTD